MGVFVQKILNTPVQSNSYVLYKKNTKESCIIDPGTEDSFDLIKFIEEHKLVPKYVIITHEHFDHIWGINKILDQYRAKLVCSVLCNKNIIDKKKNLSVFYNQLGFSTYPADILIDFSDMYLKLGLYSFTFFHTPGHSKGSLSFCIDNKLFVGDLMIKDSATVTKLPGGNKQDLDESISLLRSKFACETIIYPGHGEVFMLRDFDNKFLI